MNKIWYRKPSKSEVIGRWKHRMTTQNGQNRTLKEKKKIPTVY